MVSIEDVAHRAGVSVATVSRALRGLPNVATDTRLRVEAAARDLDYVSSPSAARLAAGRTGTLGLVLPGLGTWFGGRFMAYVHEVWSDAGFDPLLIVVDDHSDRDRFLRDLPFRKRVDGLLLLDIPFGDDEYERLAGTGVGVVTAGPRSAVVPSVGIDDRSAARSIVEHLVELGHRDIALLDGSINQPFDYTGPNERKIGVLEALDAAGLDLPDERRAETDWTPGDATVAMERILDRCDEPPTAVVCFSDEIAVGAISILRQRGYSVPRDVSVTGFDDHDLARHLGLTTVHQPVATVAARAADRLVQLVATGESEVRHEVLPTRLVVRESTAPPRDRAPVARAAASVGEPGGAS